MSDNELFKIPEEVLKKIKTQAEFEDFIQRLYKQGVEALLKAEIKEHLGYSKYDPAGKSTILRVKTAVTAAMGPVERH